MPAPPLSLVVRADATARVGAGHVMRCLALARAWRRAHGQVSIWGDVSLPFVMRRLEDERVVASPLCPGRADVLVVDTYDAADRDAGGAAGDFSVRMLVDDVGAEVPAGYHAVWNPGPAATARAYRSFRGVVLAGDGVVPLRQPLPGWRPATGAAPVAAVMLGGTRVAETLASAVSESARRAPAWSFAGLGDWSPAGWRRLDPDAPWDDASTSTALVTAAGTTMLEAAAVGIPVVVLQTADNQSANAGWARGAGVPTIDLTANGALEELPSWLGRALAAARPLPTIRDGSGAVADRLASLAGEHRTLVTGA